MADKKRYVAVIDFYIYADDNDDAVVQAQNVCDQLNQHTDCKAGVQVIVESMFGQIGKGKEVFKK